LHSEKPVDINTNPTDYFSLPPEFNKKKTKTKKKKDW